jgi:hypothetical protein
LLRRIGVGLAMVLVAAALGFGSAWWAIRHTGVGAVANGAWQTDLTIGSPAAGPYTRARVALFGLFALNRSETIYFSANHDDDGQPLRGACRYLLSGTAPAARWWSITAYGDDQFLIANAPGRYSFNMKNVEPDAAGAFQFTAAGAEQPGHWLPTGMAGYSLTLRLYNPAPDVVEHPDKIALPKIQRQGDCP